ncbi:MAG TPA: AAA family ATPase [Solirubrobacteraceae bacterium]|nr:AAA family ATPase [Solirubrobacteraceae bacterium]
MFGRVAERAQVEQVLDAVAYAPVGIAIEGAPGIGKTTVWRAAVQSARDRDYLVLEAAPSEPDAPLAFAGLGDLFERLPEEVLEALSGPQRRAVDAAVFVDDTGEPPPDPEALPRAILAVLRRLSAERPLVVAIDDEQWLDRPSARVLGFALRRLRDEHVGVVLTRRGGSDGALWPQLARGFGTSAMSTTVLAQLERSAFDRMVESRLSGAISRPLLKRIHESSGGNPLYGLAIADELGARDRRASSTRALPIPRTLTDAIGRRLEHVDASARDPLLGVALLSHPTLAILHAAIPGFVLSDLDGAERAGVIEIDGEDVRFTHPLLASVHERSMPASRRRELHRVLAGLVPGGEERAYHLALGAEAPDREIADTLERASHAAAVRGAPEAAAELLEHAARLTPMDALEQRHTRLLAAAEQHWLAGEYATARVHLQELVDKLPSGPTRARALAQLGYLRTDDFDLGTALLKEALVEAGEDHSLRAEIEKQLGQLYSNIGDFLGMLEHANAAVASAERAGDPGLLAMALGEQGFDRFWTGQVLDRDLFRRAIELERFCDQALTFFLPSTGLAIALLFADDLEAARPLHERMVQRALDRGEEVDLGNVLIGAALLEWYAGNLGAAERYLARSIEVAGQQVNEELDTWIIYQEGLHAMGRGDLARARERMQRAFDLATGGGNVQFVNWTTIALATLDSWTGKPEQAHLRLNPFREQMLERGLRFIGSGTLPMWSADVEALIALGRLDEAEPVVADLRERAMRSENPHAMAIADRCRGQLLAAWGNVAEAIDAMDAALEAHRQRPVPLELARTLLEKGALQRRAKRKTAANRTLDEALAIFEALEAPLWIERTRDELGRIGLRRAAVSEGLTPAQSRVAELAVAGLSNQEIASTLYMSTRSVESHLTKIYREYGVRSRAQLVGALARKARDEQGDLSSPFTST